MPIGAVYSGNETHFVPCRKVFLNDFFCYEFSRTPHSRHLTSEGDCEFFKRSKVFEALHKGCRKNYHVVTVYVKEATPKVNKFCDHYFEVLAKRHEHLNNLQYMQHMQGHLGYLERLFDLCPEARVEERIVGQFENGTVASALVTFAWPHHKGNNTSQDIELVPLKGARVEPLLNQLSEEEKDPL